GKEKKIRIESSSGLSPSEGERMRREAESHAEEDRKKRELIDARNKADHDIWQAEKLLKDAGDKMSDADKAPLRSAIDKVKQAASGQDIAAIDQALSDLERALYAMQQHFSQGAGRDAGAPPPSGDGQTKGKEDVIDAEFEVKK